MNNSQGQDVPGSLSTIWTSEISVLAATNAQQSKVPSGTTTLEDCEVRPEENDIQRRARGQRLETCRRTTSPCYGEGLEAESINGFLAGLW